MATKAAKGNAALYTRYPISSVLIYNGATVGHYLLGTAGIMLSYANLAAYLLGTAYLAFAFTEMYVLMPAKVCPSCVYFRLEASRCVSGLNLVSRKIARERDIKEFGNRARGALCPNNLYLAALAIPIIAIVPALFIDFSWPAMVILVCLVGLLACRFFLIFPRIACVRCRAKNVCPNARAMGMAKR